jgi:hypothetical protein
MQAMMLAGSLVRNGGAESRSAGAEDRFYAASRRALPDATATAATLGALALYVGLLGWIG